MISVLINAYACAPNRGSEPGMAWNWIIHLAKHCKLHVVTEGEWCNEIEAALKTLPQGQNITFYYNPVTPKIRQMCWNQGDWRFYYHYRKWQKSSLTLACQIIQDHPIDLVHQLNMIGFREPGYLWKIKDKPFLWGPINAKEAYPTAYLNGADSINKLFIYTKNAITKIQLLTSWRVKKAVDKACFVIASSNDSAQSIQKYYNIAPILLNESGCDLPDASVSHKTFSENTFHLLWVGRFIFTKQLDLALQTLTRIKNSNIKLHIVGGNSIEESRYKMKAQKLNISSQCTWHGIVSHADVQTFMKQFNLFFFTSVAEGTPHVVLEAISNRLPVLCFNTCGQGDSVNEKVGVKIELSNPEQSIREFAAKIEYLYNNRQVLEQMAENCQDRQKELSWDNKAKKMIGLYKKALGTNT